MSNPDSSSGETQMILVALLRFVSVIQIKRK